MTVHKNPITQDLKLSMAIELLTSRIDMETEYFQQNKVEFDSDDLEEIVECMKFITANSRHSYSGTIIDIEMHLDKLRSK